MQTTYEEVTAVTTRNGITLFFNFPLAKARVILFRCFSDKTIWIIWANLASGAEVIAMSYSTWMTKNAVISEPKPLQTLLRRVSRDHLSFCRYVTEGYLCSCCNLQPNSFFHIRLFIKCCSHFFYRSLYCNYFIQQTFFCEMFYKRDLPFSRSRSEIYQFRNRNELYPQPYTL